MAELNIFHYLPQESVIHRMDGRIKLMCMILFSVTVSVGAGIKDLLILTSVLCLALLVARLPVQKLFAEVRYFLILIGVIVIVHSFSIPGTPVKSLPIPGLTFEGISSGLIFGWKLVLIIVICLLLTGTTTLSALKNVIEWLLRPVPFIPEARVGAMFSLTFVLIPLVFDQASQILDAQKARCVENRKNPLKRITMLAFPLLWQTFLRADEMTQAMEARCYSEIRIEPVFKASYRDWLFLFFSAMVCAIVWFI